MALFGFGAIWGRAILTLLGNLKAFSSCIRPHSFLRAIKISGKIASDVIWEAGFSERQ